MNKSWCRAAGFVEDRVSNFFGHSGKVRQSLVLFAILFQISPSVQAQPLCSKILLEDPYAWLEVETPERNAWIQKQTGDVHRALKSSPNRPIFEKQFRDQWSVERVLAKREKGGWTLKMIDRGLGAPHGTEVTAQAKDGPERVIFSSNNLRRNNSLMPVGISASPDGKWVVVSVSEKGSIDLFSAHVVEVATGKTLHVIEGLGAEKVTWSSMESFRFRRELGERPIEATIAGGRVQEKSVPHDGLAEVRGEGDWIYHEVVGADGKRSGRILSLTSQKSFTVANGGLESVIAVRPDLFLAIFRSPKENFVVSIRPELQGDAKIGVLSSIDSTRVLDAIRVVGDRVAVETFWGASRSTELVHPDRPSERFTIEAPGCCEVYVRKFSEQTGEVEALLASPIRDYETWTFNSKTKKWSFKGVEADPAREMSSSNGIEYVVDYPVFRSKDGTEIPMRVTYRKDLRLDGTNPALLQGYGGFGINSYFHPSFDGAISHFLSQGGIHLTPALRGSTFFGQSWHDRGRAENKQNVIDDFIGAAEWAVASRLTRPDRIAISGDSHGGLVVGSSVTQRPDLFGLAFPRFGPLDFARKAILDPRTTPFQKYEYGDLMGADPKALSLAAALSPFGRIETRDYPMVVVTTGQVDSRVNPMHSYRFAARLQDAQTGPAPIWMYSLKNSGHWMLSQPRQDLLAWRSNVTFWTIVYDYFGMKR